MVKNTKRGRGRPRREPKSSELNVRDVRMSDKCGSVCQFVFISPVIGFWFDNKCDGDLSLNFYTNIECNMHFNENILYVCRMQKHVFTPHSYNIVHTTLCYWIPTTKWPLQHSSSTTLPFVGQANEWHAIKSQTTRIVWHANANVY